MLLVALGAPPELSGYFGCMLVSVAVLAAITTVWKISIHCAVACGSVTILGLMYGPRVIPRYALVALTAWSRVVLKDHTTAQVIAGLRPRRRRGRGHVRGHPPRLTGPARGAS